METKQEIANQFDKMVKIIGEQSGYSVDFTRHKNLYARIYPDRRKLEISGLKWEDFSDEKKMQVLLHELSHIGTLGSKHEGNHKLNFWKTYVKNYKQVKQNKEILNGNYNWKKIAKLVVKDAHAENVDRRQITVGELRGRLEDKLGVTVVDSKHRDKWSSKFDSINEVSTVRNAGYDTQIYFSEFFGKGPDHIHGNLKGNNSDKTIWKKFKDLRQDKMGKGHWRLPKPKVKNDEPNEEERQGRLKIRPCSQKDKWILIIAQRLESNIVPKWNAC